MSTIALLPADAVLFSVLLWVECSVLSPVAGELSQLLLQAKSNSVLMLKIFALILFFLKSHKNRSNGFMTQLWKTSKNVNYF
jgi:hypothetical protein